MTTMKSTLVTFVVIRYLARKNWKDTRRLYMMGSDTLVDNAIIKQIKGVKKISNWTYLDTILNLDQKRNVRNMGLI